MPDVIAFDTETFYDKKCSVKPLGAWAYTRHPEFYAFLFSVYDGHELWVGEPKDFNWDALRGAHLLSHNTFFDRNVYEAGVEKNLYPKIEFVEWDCTANMSAFLCNRRSLKDAIMFLFGRELSKDARGRMEGVHWSDVKDKEQGKEFISYAGIDAIECWNIFDKYKDRWPQFEREISRLTITQCLRGVQIDVEKLDRYIESAKKLLFAIEARLPWIQQGEKPTGTKAIAMLCREVGIPTPPVKSREGEEAFVAWENQFGPKYPWIGAVGQWRSLNKFIGILEKIKSRLRPDGSLSFGQKYFGAHTGRDSGDAGINLKNMKRDPIFVTNDDLMRMDDAAGVEYWNVVEAIQEAEKSLLTAPKVLTS